jgi:hypothetical protein
MRFHLTQSELNRFLYEKLFSETLNPMGTRYKLTQNKVMTKVRKFIIELLPNKLDFTLVLVLVLVLKHSQPPIAVLTFLCLSQLT